MVVAGGGDCRGIRRALRSISLNPHSVKVFRNPREKHRLLRDQTGVTVLFKQMADKNARKQMRIETIVSNNVLSVG